MIYEVDPRLQEILFQKTGASALKASDSTLENKDKTVSYQTSAR